MKDKEIDYKTLLAKYIEHVGAEEGCTFIGRLYRKDNGQYEGMSCKIVFNAEEVKALYDCSNVYEFCEEL